ncbi:thioesterase II family protein [Nonomuraea jiangxiensis]|uniref:Alpha/beta hydrolase family protein n=1 Tax=Nonomuraea jiangxiensis TaxID=633440 RepID=A0A1G9JF34_9ACTN|nr:alpha/beta fold hydrolase [Nonomuraea jiangxiensis]SDL35912.1 Alpha/beta hydrolase family protein [Nonomuraea jiangxiensis]
MESSSYIISPALDGDEAVIFVPGLGGRTKFVDGWNEPGLEPVIHRANWSEPMNVPSIEERGAALSSLVARSGVTDVVLVGHSMGALVCLEAGKHLERRLRGTVVMCQYPPHRTPLSPLAELPDRALAEEIEAPPHILNTTALSEYARLWRSEYRLLNRYLEADPRPLLDAPLIAVGATDDASSWNADSLNDWSQYTTEWLSVQMIAGGHQVVEQLPPETLREWVGKLRG